MAAFFALVFGSVLMAYAAAYPTVRLSTSRLTPWWLVAVVCGWLALGPPAVAWGGTARELASWASPLLGAVALVGARITVGNRMRMLAEAAAVNGQTPPKGFMDPIELAALFADARNRLEDAMARDPGVRAKVEEVRRSYPPLAKA